MIIEEDFTSHKLTLKFETTGRRIGLSKEESLELEQRFQEIHKGLGSGDSHYEKE